MGESVARKVSCLVGGLAHRPTLERVIRSEPQQQQQQEQGQVVRLPLALLACRSPERALIEENVEEESKCERVSESACLPVCLPVWMCTCA